MRGGGEDNPSGETSITLFPMTGRRHFTRLDLGWTGAMGTANNSYLAERATATTGDDRRISLYFFLEGSYFFPLRESTSVNLRQWCRAVDVVRLCRR